MIFAKVAAARQPIFRYGEYSFKGRPRGGQKLTTTSMSLRCALWRKVFECETRLGNGVVADNQFRHADAKVIVEHQHFATGDEPAIDVNVDRIPGELVERYDRPFFQS